jgi:hypothetical protein
MAMMAIAAVVWALPTTAASSTSPRILISKSKLGSLGLGFGPDSIATRYVGPNGHAYLYFTASSKSDPLGPYALYRFALGSADKATLPIKGKPKPVLQPAISGQANPVPWCANQPCFDQNYSGGGTLLRCPNHGPLLLAYHGENHTDPQGERMGKEGWSGIGLARWDAGQQKFIKIDQIIGLDASNVWQQTPSGWQTHQAPALSFQADMVLNPTNKMVYLYYGDKLPGTTEPYIGGRIALAAIKLGTLCHDAAVGTHANFQKWFNGSFSQPGVNTTAANPQHLPPGTGGRFTPIINTPRQTAPDVIYHQHHWYMVNAPSLHLIELRSSHDGIHWSSPRTIYVPKSGYVLYPYLWAPSAKGKSAYVTFTWHSTKPMVKGTVALEEISITL